MNTRKFWMIIIPLAMVIGLLFAGCGGTVGCMDAETGELSPPLPSPLHSLANPLVQGILHHPL